MESTTTQYIREAACSSDIVSLYPVTSILWQAKTSYADAVIAEVPTLGTCLFLDQEIQSSSSDEDIYHECLAHPVMASAPSRRRVLVVGGGEGATVREILKWRDVEAVTWVDIDAEVVEACRKHMKWGQDAAYTDPRVTFHAEDIRSFVRKAKEAEQVWNVIILDLPDPDPSDNPLAQDVLMNRAFWCGIKAVLAPGGVWVSHTGPVRRGPSGADFIGRATAMADFYAANATPYHVVIPAFQDDWGYVMSCRPVFEALPIPVRFLTLQAYRYIFTWPYPVNAAAKKG